MNDSIQALLRPSSPCERALAADLRRDIGEDALFYTIVVEAALEAGFAAGDAIEAATDVLPQDLFFDVAA